MSKRRRLSPAERRAGPDHGATQRSFARVEPFNSPFAILPAPTEPEIARQIAPARERGPRIRTANFDAILANDLLDVVAARVTRRSKASRG